MEKIKEVKNPYKGLTDNQILENEKTISLITDFAKAINKVNAENGSNTPDFILANYLIGCLKTFDQFIKMRDDWYNVYLSPTKKIINNLKTEENGND